MKIQQETIIISLAALLLVSTIVFVGVEIKQKYDTRESVLKKISQDNVVLTVYEYNCLNDSEKLSFWNKGGKVE